MIESAIAASPTTNDMIGSTIEFIHDNRFLYPGRYVGVVTSYSEDRRGEGWLTVKSPSFNLEKRIHESQLKRYIRLPLSPVVEKAIAA